MARRKSNSNESEITDRQAEVLNMVVSGFIHQSQPVSSFYIIENYDVNLSSATIRSVFAALEKKGYLFSPHRSSGRIPTEKAYRYFVDQLPPPAVLLDEDQRVIQAEYLKHEFRLPDILDVTSRILSMLTTYAAVVLGPEPEQAVLKHIELIDMGEDEVLVILVTRSGAVYSRTLFLENRIPGDTLRQISRQLNEMFKGMDLSEIRERLKSSIEGANRYFPLIAKTIAENFDSVSGEEEVFTYGLDNLYRAMAESGEPGRLRDIGELFHHTDFLRGVFKKAISLDDVEVVIEGDRDERLAGLSVISASYKMGEKRIGSLGIVGPNRMDYVRVMSIVEYIRRLTTNMVTRISK